MSLPAGQGTGEASKKLHKTGSFLKTNTTLNATPVNYPDHRLRSIIHSGVCYTINL